MTASQPQRHVMEVGFPGGLAVSASFRGHEILTDQPEKAGGTDTGPPPFDLFLASIATCAGFYALRFCQSRDIATEGLTATLEPIRDPETPSHRPHPHRAAAAARLPDQVPSGDPAGGRPVRRQATHPRATRVRRRPGRAGAGPGLA